MADWEPCPEVDLGMNVLECNPSQQKATVDLVRSTEGVTHITFTYFDNDTGEERDIELPVGKR